MSCRTPTRSQLVLVIGLIARPLVTQYFAVWVPSGRAINPITKTNWERVGVRPDIAVASDQALRTAHLAALRRLRQLASDPERQEALDRAIADVERDRH